MQISTGVSTKWYLLLYQVIMFFSQPLPMKKHLPHLFIWHRNVGVVFLASRSQMTELCFASFLQTNSRSGTNQVCSLVYCTWKCTTSASHWDTNRHCQREVAVVRMLILELPDSLCKTQGFFIDHKSTKASKKETTWCLQAYLSSLRFYALMWTLTTAHL